MRSWMETGLIWEMLWATAPGTFFKVQEETLQLILRPSTARSTYHFKISAN